MKSKKENRGGKRKGAGRKSLPDNLKKVGFLLYITPHTIKVNGGRGEVTTKCLKVLGVN